MTNEGSREIADEEECGLNSTSPALNWTSPAIGVADNGGDDDEEEEGEVNDAEKRAGGTMEGISAEKVMQWKGKVGLVELKISDGDGGAGNGLSSSSSPEFSALNASSSASSSRQHSALHSELTSRKSDDIIPLPGTDDFSGTSIYGLPSGCPFEQVLSLVILTSSIRLTGN